MMIFSNLRSFLAFVFTLALCVLFVPIDLEAHVSKQDQVEALERDLSILIWQTERLDWVIDEYSLRSLAPRLMEAICLSSEDVHKIVRQKLQSQIDKNGGFLQKRWHKDMKVSDYKDDLHTERMLAALNWASAQKSACPAWLNHDKPFIGLHQDAYRFQLILESMGSGQLVMNSSDWTIGGAAQGRALAMYGFTSRLGLAVGAEVGAASVFPKDSTGRRSVEASWAVGLPVVLRAWVGSFRYDTELALLSRLADQNGQAIYGIRFAQAFGVSTSRIAGFLPHIMLWGGYEYFGETHILRVGTRVGVSWW